MIDVILHGPPTQPAAYYVLMSCKSSICLDICQVCRQQGFLCFVISGFLAFGKTSHFVIVLTKVWDMRLSVCLLQWCPSCLPTNSIKALKALKEPTTKKWKNRKTKKYKQISSEVLADIRGNWSWKDCLCHSDVLHESLHCDRLLMAQSCYSEGLPGHR